VCDLRSEVLAVVSRKRLEVRGGEVSKGVTVYHAAIAGACLRIAAALPAVGPFTAQCILKDGAPFFTEINARFGGGLPLGIRGGQGFAELWGLFEQGVRGCTFDRWLTGHGLDASGLTGRLVEVYRGHEPELAPFPGTRELLTSLRRRYRLGLLSDGYLDV